MSPLYHVHSFYRIDRGCTLLLMESFMKISNYIVLIAGIILFSGCSTIISNTTLNNDFGDAEKGRQIFLSEIKNKCSMNGQRFAASHTQSEWKELYERGEITKEVNTMCQQKVLNEHTETVDLYAFTVKFASDSGEMPSCGN